MEELEFRVVERRARPSQLPRPHLSLVKDNWNDFGNVVQFHLHFVELDGEDHYIGVVKILQRLPKSRDRFAVRTKTSLPEVFSSLDENYISLGQSDAYYEKLREIGEKFGKRVLRALNDIALFPKLAIEFEPSSVFRNALMRESGALRARRFGRDLIRGREIREDVSFTYRSDIWGDEDVFDASFDFDGGDELPGRIIALIGRNAVGKTRLLSRLADDLTHLMKTSLETSERRQRRFPSGRPYFTKVIAISYSAFDRFRRPRAESTSSYVYCGIRTEGGGLSQRVLLERFRDNRARIDELNRTKDWQRCMRLVLGDHTESLEKLLADEDPGALHGTESLAELSSGQSILCHFVTALLANIQPTCLVLFDEPETHLHPNAVANLFIVLHDILETYDCYAIVATHSPLVVQEIPAKRVLVLERDGQSTSCEPMTSESFGANLSDLTRHLFETIEVQSLYRKTLSKLAERESLEDVLGRFDMELSPNAQSYLLGRYTVGRRKRG